MEKTLWSGRSSWSCLLNTKDVVLGMLTGGLWLIVPVVRILSSHYELTDQSFVITRGIITKQVDQVDLYRVQDIQMRKGILSGDITIKSSDKSKPVIKVPGVKDAAALRSMIRAAAQKSKENHGVRLQENL